MRHAMKRALATLLAVMLLAAAFGMAEAPDLEIEMDGDAPDIGNLFVDGDLSLTDLGLELDLTGLELEEGMDEEVEGTGERDEGTGESEEGTGNREEGTGMAADGDTQKPSPSGEGGTSQGDVTEEVVSSDDGEATDDTDGEPPDPISIDDDAAAEAGATSDGGDGAAEDGDDGVTGDDGITLFGEGEAGEALLPGEEAAAEDAEMTGLSGAGTEPDPYKINSWADLKDALKTNTGEYLKVERDIKATESDQGIRTYKTATLNLDGHVVDRGLQGQGVQGLDFAIQVAEQNTLTIKGSDGGKITGGSNA